MSAGGGGSDGPVTTGCRHRLQIGSVCDRSIAVDVSLRPDIAPRAALHAVRLLLDAGADKRQLEWTPLMESVALGSPADVQAALGQGAALEARDWWSRRSVGSQRM